MIFCALLMVFVAPFFPQKNRGRTRPSGGLPYLVLLVVLRPSQPAIFWGCEDRVTGCSSIGHLAVQSPLLVATALPRKASSLRPTPCGTKATKPYVHPQTPTATPLHGRVAIASRSSGRVTLRRGRLVEYVCCGHARRADHLEAVSTAHKWARLRLCFRGCRARGAQIIAPI